MRINIPDLDKHDPDAQKSAPEHEAELVFETNDDCYIKIFFDPKVSGIRTMSMTNQFESYFNYIEMDPLRYSLAFKELKSLRDNIFHGRPIKDKGYLKKVNWYEHLPRLVGELLIKFFGIRDLKKIERKAVYG